MPSYKNYLRYIAKLPQDKITQSIIILLTFYIAFLIAKTAWLVIPMHSSAAQLNLPTNQLSTQKTVQTNQGVNLQPLLELNLFGKVPENIGQPIEIEEQTAAFEAPITSLNVRLTGVVAIPSTKKGSAIIQNGTVQETYFVEDNIKGTSAEIYEIYSNRVILKLGGKYETLMLDGIDYEVTSQPSRKNSTANLGRKANRANRTNVEKQPQINSSRQRNVSAKKKPKQVIDRRKDPALAQELAAQKEAILSNPGALFDFIKVSPVRRNGQIAGYRLRPGKNPQLFTRSGLRTNDLAIKINGYQLSDPQQAMTILKELKETTEASILVERRGEQIEVLFSLDNPPPPPSVKNRIKE